jgi:hypothetical protein
MPQPLMFYIILAAAILVLFVAGSFMSVQSSEIGSCKASWYLYTKSVNSTLCPNPDVACDAESYKQQHNVLVDLLLCACDKKESGTDARISDVYYQMSSMNLTADQVCSNTVMLMKWNY